MGNQAMIDVSCGFSQLKLEFELRRARNQALIGAQKHHAGPPALAGRGAPSPSFFTVSLET
jgi:hypothetical protein